MTDLIPFHASCKFTMMMTVGQTKRFELLVELLNAMLQQICHRGKHVLDHGPKGYGFPAGSRPGDFDLHALGA